jgi:hypothetical protein
MLIDFPKMKIPRTSLSQEIIFSGISMDHHPTSFFILENTQLGTFWVGQAKMSHLPAVTRDGLIQKLETRYPEYGSPCLHLVSINKNGTFPFYGVERWLSKLEYRLKQSPHKHEELRNLLTAGWHSHDFTINSTLNVLHSIYKTDLKVLYKRLLDEWKSRGLRCLNTQTGKSYSERYEKCKKDPEFMYRRARKEVLRQMKKTKKLPKPETLAKYDIKEDELREIMGPKGIIYKITSPSGKVYVGQTMRSFEKRMREHKSKHSGCTLLRNAIQKYDDEMKYEIIEEDVPQEQLDEREIYWINYFNSLAPSGYNLGTGGHYERGYTQEAKDNMRNATIKSKIEKYGHLGSVELCGNLFYPKAQNNCTKIFLSNGGFRTKEECIEVLKEYTKNPDNFIKVDSPYKRKDGSVLKRTNTWSVKYKNKYLGEYETEEEGWEAIEKYQRDPENFTKPEKKVGSITKRCNRWKTTYKNTFLGSYDTQKEAQDAIERYLKDPENFIKPESKTYSITTQGNKWLLKSNGRIVKFYTTREEAEEARKALQSSL